MLNSLTKIIILLVAALAMVSSFPQYSFSDGSSSSRSESKNCVNGVCTVRTCVNGACTVTNGVSERGGGNGGSGGNEQSERNDQSIGNVEYGNNGGQRWLQQQGGGYPILVNPSWYPYNGYPLSNPLFGTTTVNCINGFCTSS